MISRPELPTKFKIRAGLRGATGAIAAGPHPLQGGSRYEIICFK